MSTSRTTRFPYTTLFRSSRSGAGTSATDLQKAEPSYRGAGDRGVHRGEDASGGCRTVQAQRQDRKSTRLNSSHLVNSYAVFCLKKKKQEKKMTRERTNIS